MTEKAEHRWLCEHFEGIFSFNLRQKWTLVGFNAFAMDITRTTNNQVEYSTRYFVTSLNYEQINTFVKAVRQHWQIEVDLHWSLDVSFREDLNQSRIGHSAENLALVRRIALNLLKQESTHQHGISCRRKTAGWDHQYLLKVLTADQRFK